jgi:hypothetical protein
MDDRWELVKWAIVAVVLITIAALAWYMVQHVNGWVGTTEGY